MTKTKKYRPNPSNQWAAPRVGEFIEDRGGRWKIVRVTHIVHGGRGVELLLEKMQ
jgi:hypothetical protein